MISKARTNEQANTTTYIEVQWHPLDVLKLFIHDDLVDASKKPVDDLNEWDDAESKTEAKEPSEGGNEVDRTHSDASLKL